MNLIKPRGLSGPREAVCAAGVRWFVWLLHSSPRGSELSCITTPGRHLRWRGPPAVGSGETETQRRPGWGWAPPGEMIDDALCSLLRGSVALCPCFPSGTQQTPISLGVGPRQVLFRFQRVWAIAQPFSSFMASGLALSGSGRASRRCCEGGLA